MGDQPAHTFVAELQVVACTDKAFVNAAILRSWQPRRHADFTASRIKALLQAGRRRRLLR